MTFDYLPYHHTSVGTDQELLFSDTEPMDAAGKAPNPPNEFLEAKRQASAGTLVRGRG